MITRQEEQLVARDALLAELKAENQTLREKVDYLIRVIYGAKSEKLDPAQLEILFDPDGAKKPDAAGTDEDEPAAEEKASNVVPISKGKKPARRQPRLPKNLPITATTTLIPDEVLKNPDLYREIGKQTSRRLSVEPPRYGLELTIRPTYVLAGDELATPFSAALPPCLLEKSLLSPSLLAHVLVGKFNDHLPFYRQAQIMERRHGIKVGDNTLCHWAEIGAQTLEPLYKIIASDLRGCSFLQIDETPVDYLEPGHGQTKEGRFWVYHHPEVGVLYDWHSSRKSSCLDTILLGSGLGDEDFAGVIQCDGYSGYTKWRGEQDGLVLLAGCWAHVRRKFFEASKHSPQQAAPFLQLIRELYGVETKLRAWLATNNHPPEVRKYYRRRFARPIIKKIRRLLKQQQMTKGFLPKSKLGDAVGYALNQWDRLEVYLHIGEVEIDNNLAENAVRPLKLGAKNWLFIGAEDTGWRSAVIYTLIENCRQLKMDPFAYLKDVFARLLVMTNQDDLRTLLPAAWKERKRIENQSDASRAAA